MALTYHNRIEISVPYPRERLPFAPLEALGDPAEIAEGAGFAPRNVFRWRRAGLLPNTADLLACSMGLHPANIWPEEWAVVPA